MRKIIHVDMDCFYAAVEEKHNPELKGKPVGIGGPPDSRSVLCTANYEARKFGVKAALPSSRAVRLCPQLILIPPNFDLYKEESKRVRKIFESFTDLVEPLSLDEAYLDVTAASEKYGSASAIAVEIRKRIAIELNLTASAGVAPNKFLAKVASDWKKPNGMFVIPPQKVADFVKDLPIEKIFGVGKVTAGKMHDLGLHTCEDIQKMELLELKRNFGSFAHTLRQFSFGIDEREVETEWERKSLSVETTFAQDLDCLPNILDELPSLFQDWQTRMEKGEYYNHITGLFIKLKFYDFKQTTHEERCAQDFNIKTFERLIEQAWLRSPSPVRLLGIGARLGSREQAQISFFD